MLTLTILMWLAAGMRSSSSFSCRGKMLHLPVLVWYQIPRDCTKLFVAHPDFGGQMFFRYRGGLQAALWELSPSDLCQVYPEPKYHEQKYYMIYMNPSDCWWCSRYCQVCGVKLPFGSPRIWIKMSSNAKGRFVVWFGLFFHGILQTYSHILCVYIL